MFKLWSFLCDQRGPSSKPKYSSMIDSVQVLWGKGKKNPKKGSAIENLKSNAKNKSNDKAG